jgi:hypothetical protein
MLGSLSELTAFRAVRATEERDLARDVYWVRPVEAPANAEAGRAAAISGSESS